MSEINSVSMGPQDGGAVADFDQERAEKAVKELLLAIGENPDREGLKDTPARVARALKENFAGLWQKPEEVLATTFDIGHSELVIVKDIELYSMCEHHLLPFFGKCHVAYIPRTKVIGLSKIPRLVEVFSRRLQIQERLTKQIATAIQEAINPAGVAVVIEAKHLCMMMRGVEKQNSVMTTSAMLGLFRKEINTRSEFLNLINHR